MRPGTAALFGSARRHALNSIIEYGLSCQCLQEHPIIKSLSATDCSLAASVRNNDGSIFIVCDEIYNQGLQRQNSRAKYCLIMCSPRILWCKEIRRFVVFAIAIERFAQDKPL